MFPSACRVEPHLRPGAARRRPDAGNDAAQSSRIMCYRWRAVPEHAFHPCRVSRSPTSLRRPVTSSRGVGRFMCPLHCLAKEHDGCILPHRGHCMFWADVTTEGQSLISAPNSCRPRGIQVAPPGYAPRIGTFISSNPPCRHTPPSTRYAQWIRLRPTVAGAISIRHNCWIRRTSLDLSAANQSVCLVRVEPSRRSA